MAEVRYKRTLLLAMFGSGFSALVLEVLWTKHLSLTFGSNIWAVGMVVATFMAGLALGGGLFGQIADRARNPLRMYAALELGIAVSAILFRPALWLVEAGFVGLHRQYVIAPALSTVMLLGFSSILLLPPTLCMGGTLPVVSRLLQRGSFQKDISLMYAANVAGAAVGVFLAGYYLIPFLGLTLTEALAYGINLALAVGFWWLGRNPLEQKVTVEAEAEAAFEPLVTTTRRSSNILFCTFLVGASALALQLLWNRVLVLYMGSTTYTFSSILCIYLISMATGGAVFSQLRKRFASLPQLFAALCFAAGLYVLATAPFYDHLTYLVLDLHHWVGQNWWLYTLLMLPIVFLVVGPPALFSGALFPAALAIFSPEANRVGRRVGWVVMFNTLGAMVGSLAGAFWFVPQFGLLTSFKIAAGFMLMSGVAIVLGLQINLSRWTRVAFSTAFCLSLVLLMYPFVWDVKLMNTGVYYYATEVNEYRADLQKALATQQLLASYEGIDATVTVKDNLTSGVRSLTVNGKTDGGTGGDMTTQILLGQLPVLLHPDPREVLVIGLGTGVTLGALAQSSARRIDCVEISPAVIKASEYFQEYNGNPIADPRVKIHIKDGRNYLLLHRGSYDVITSEPSNPWQVGNSNLFTYEFFRLVREKLNADGVFCQWLPLYDLSPDKLKVLLRTFSSVFPETHLFIQQSDLLMIGSNSKITINYQEMKHRLARHYYPGSLSVFSSPADMLARHYLFSGALVEEFSDMAKLNTDTHPILEYSGRYSLADRTLRFSKSRRNISALYGVVERKKQVLPLANLGSSPEEIERSTQEIMESFAREQRAPVSSLNPRAEP